MRVLVALIVLGVLAGCAGGIGGAADDDPLRRTVITFEVGSQLEVVMDLRGDPTVERVEGTSITQGDVVELGAARELRDRLLELPPRTGDCPLTVEPLFSASIATYPEPEVAEFADLAYEEVGGPCSDLDSGEVGELVALWNQAGGSLEAPG